MMYNLCQRNPQEMFQETLRGDIDAWTYFDFRKEMGDDVRLLRDPFGGRLLSLSTLKEKEIISEREYDNFFNEERQRRQRR